ncbi:hypothetical protein BDR06DRAFT_880609, partial [Suillus hirtellus]
RHVNTWNSFMRTKLQDANMGECIKLTKFITENKASLLRAYGPLKVAEKQAYNAWVLQACQEKRSAAHANPKAIQHDMNATFTSMDYEVGATYTYKVPSLTASLCAHINMQGFSIAVCGGIEDFSEPKIFFTKKAQKFVLSVIRVEPQHLGLKLEVFVVGKLNEHVISNNSCPLNKLITECHELIQDGLGFILLEKNGLCKVKINYRKIQAHYS